MSVWLDQEVQTDNRLEWDLWENRRRLMDFMELMLTGSYGKESYDKVWDAIYNKRKNSSAVLYLETAVCEYGETQESARKMYKAFVNGAAFPYQNSLGYTTADKMDEWIQETIAWHREQKEAA